MELYLAKDNGITVDYIQTIKMVDIFLRVFDMNEQMAIDKKIDEQLELAKKNINQKVKGIPVPTDHGR